MMLMCLSKHQSRLNLDHIRLKLRLAVLYARTSTLLNRNPVFIMHNSKVLLNYVFRMPSDSRTNEDFEE
jgi:hypothetical protein